MQSTRDFLSDGSQTELLFLTTVVRNTFANTEAGARAEELVDALVKFMQRHNLTLEYAEDNRYNRQLLDLLMTAVLGNLALTEFNKQLIAWANEYKTFVASDRAVLRARHASQPAGIFRTLTQGKDANDVFGDDYDAMLLLREFIVRNAEDIKENQFNILAPISMDVADDLFNVVDSMRPGNEGKKFDLVALVNCGQYHWRIAKFSLQNSKVIDACLWDSLHGDSAELARTPAYQHLQDTITRLNGDDSVVSKAEMAGVQSNSIVCMDRGVQEIFRVVNIKHPLVEAQTDEVVRNTTIAAICEKHADLRVENEVPSSAQVEEVQDEEGEKEAEVPSSVVSADEEVIYHFLNQSKNKDKQIQFDQAMAEKLQASLSALAEGDGKEKEKALFDQARKHAFELQKFGLMAKPCSREIGAPAAVTKPPIFVK